MLRNRNREKLFNAIIYFAENTRHLGKIKLFKLLYLMDFEHFRQTGRSVTGMEYSAWKFGPVPNQLMQEWEQPEADFAETFDIEAVRVINFIRDEVRPKRGFDDSPFTRRELQIMADLAACYRDVLSADLIDVTHAENEAWARAWNGGQGQFDTIPYVYAIADDDLYRDEVLESAREYDAINKAHRHH